MQYYTPQHHTAVEQLTRGASLRTTSHRNFLFLMPEGVSELERSIVMVAARRMTEDGYVYMAESGQKTMEDRDGIRFMRLDEENLPGFGLMTTVVVLHSQDLAERALESYPDAQVFLLNPRVEAATQEEAMLNPAFTANCFSQASPMVMGQMVAHQRKCNATVISIPASAGMMMARAS